MNIAYQLFYIVFGISLILISISIVIFALGFLLQQGNKIKCRSRKK